MNNLLRLTRRAALGAGFAAAFLGSTALAAPVSRKLVVVIARGGMDGLSAVPPVGDPDYSALRGPIALSADEVLALDGMFGLHPRLEALHALIRAGEARIAPAAAIPERIRSHFEAQDLLESGGGGLGGVASGWLNRALQAGGARGAPLKALAVGAQTPLILRGPVQAQSWSPGAGLPQNADDLISSLQHLYMDDELLGPAFASGLETEAMVEAATEGRPIRRNDAHAFAVATGRFLAAPEGPQAATLSLGGFDTHARQGAAGGQLAQRLATLDQVLAGLKAGLGANWRDTVVVTVTEFGRTARMNGTGGTDHGTASTLILAGGALARGGLIGDWPGLAEQRLFQNRDLAPTLDVRAVFKGLLIDHLGLDRRAVETTVFPDSRKAQPIRGLVA